MNDFHFFLANLPPSGNQSAQSNVVIAQPAALPSSAAAQAPIAINLVSDAAATKVVTSAVTSVSKAQPVIRPVAQTVEEEKNFKTTVTHHVGGMPEDGNTSPKPVAAPRQSLLTDDRTTSVSRASSVRSSSTSDAMSKSHNSLEFGDVQLRRSELLLEHRPAKPEIPARPASLAPAKR